MYTNIYIRNLYWRGPKNMSNIKGTEMPSMPNDYQSHEGISDRYVVILHLVWRPSLANNN